MSPKEKAQKLVWKYIELKESPTLMMKDLAKACALVAVEEIMQELKTVDRMFWREVKQEIEKL